MPFDQERDFEQPLRRYLGRNAVVPSDPPRTVECWCSVLGDVNLTIKSVGPRAYMPRQHAPDQIVEHERGKIALPEWVRYGGQGEIEQYCSEVWRRVLLDLHYPAAGYGPVAMEHDDNGPWWSVTLYCAPGGYTVVPLPCVPWVDSVTVTRTSVDDLLRPPPPIVKSPTQVYRRRTYRLEAGWRLYRDRSGDFGRGLVCYDEESAIRAAQRSWSEHWQAVLSGFYDEEEWRPWHGWS